MIEYKKDGNIFDTTCDFIVNPVNCVGIMGAGLAAEFKKRYPDMLADYVQVCRNQLLAPGKMHVFMVLPGKYVVNLPTKIHWQSPASISIVEIGVNVLADFVENTNLVRSIAIPKLGCGLGGLSWHKVKPIIVGRFSSLGSVYTEIYE